MSKDNIKKYLNRGISTPIAFFVIILLAALVGIGAWYFSQNQNDNPETVQTAIPTTTIEPIPSTTPTPIITPIVDLSFEIFIAGLREILETNCSHEQMYENEYVGEYNGFPWINEDKEVELIKGYHMVPTIEYPSMGKDCKDRILNYLEVNLISNTENTSDRVLGFEKEDIKCLFYTGCSEFECLDCGDITKSITPEAYKGIYQCLNSEMKPGKSFEIGKVMGDFAISGYIYYAILLKKTDDGWINLYETQDTWECEIVFEHEVPPSLIGNMCMFYETTREVWRYDEELGKWEKWYHIDNPWDKE